MKRVLNRYSTPRAREEWPLSIRQMAGDPHRTRGRALVREQAVRAIRARVLAPDDEVSVAQSVVQLGAPRVPTPIDHVVFLAGVPIAPWIEPRPLAETWQVWLAHLRSIIEGQLQSGGLPPDAGDDAWHQWSVEHLHAYRFRRVTSGLSWLLARLATCEAEEGAGVHLVGHSAGGAAALALLAGLRARLFAPLRLPLRSVVTLDAAVSGLAGRWTHMDAFLRHTVRMDLQDLGLWTREQGITLLTVANVYDLWSHRPLADIPYLGLPIGLPTTLRAHLDGSVHAELRDSPAIIEALWPGALSLEETTEAREAGE